MASIVTEIDAIGELYSSDESRPKDTHMCQRYYRLPSRVLALAKSWDAWRLGNLTWDVLLISFFLFAHVAFKRLRNDKLMGCLQLPNHSNFRLLRPSLSSTQALGIVTI